MCEVFGLYCKESVNINCVYVYEYFMFGAIIIYDVGG